MEDVIRDAPLKPCACGVDHLSHVIYRGRIREGAYGHFSRREYLVMECGRCGLRRLNADSLDYSTASYRVQVDGSSEIGDAYSRHDYEQADRLATLGTGGWRDQIVADVGCGAGSFLDFLSGVCKSTLAIDPAIYYHQALLKKGHLVFASMGEALNEWRGRVDRVTGFAVIEHVDDPLQFLIELRALLRAGGEAWISTPNAKDWLLQAAPETYPSFFYRRAHLWYFDESSLRNLARSAGFKDVDIIYRHQYDLGNALEWLQLGRPVGHGSHPELRGLDGSWKQELERLGQSNYFYARLS